MVEWMKDLLCMSSRVGIPKPWKSWSGDTRLSSSTGEEADGRIPRLHCQLDFIATMNSAKVQAAGSRRDPALEAKVQGRRKRYPVPPWPSYVHVWSECTYGYT